MGTWGFGGVWKSGMQEWIRLGSQAGGAGLELGNMVGLSLTSYPNWLCRDLGAQIPCNCLPSTARLDSHSSGLRVYF